jgi:tRNA 2-thiouridine synthesizing protein E
MYLESFILNEKKHTTENVHTPTEIKHMLSVDEDGFLCHLNDWNQITAELLARNEGIKELLSAHWELIYIVRQFHQEFDISPTMRPLIKYIKLHLSYEKANSIYLLSFFPTSPAKLIAKIAGLPRPENCL